MAKKKPATNVFDPEKFGRKVREERRLAGFKNTKEFSEAIKNSTGVFIDFDTLMKYERGEREPDISKTMAIAFTLYKRDWGDGLFDLLRFSFPEDVPYFVLRETVLGLGKDIKAMQEAVETKEIAALSKSLDISFDEASRIYKTDSWQKLANAGGNYTELSVEQINELLAFNALRRLFDIEPPISKEVWEMVKSGNHK